MFDILTETFIFEYFLYNALLGKNFPSKEIFETLSEVFCLRKNEDLYALLESEIVKEIVTEGDYKRYKRIKQYNELTNQPHIFGEKEEILISLKGKAIITANQYNLFATNEMTKTLIERNLHQYAKQGCIIAMRVLGTLECAGIVVEQNKISGLKYLEKATHWADTFAGLSLIKYDKDRRKKTLEKINASISDTPYRFLSETLQKEYKIETNKKNEEILLVKKAFSTGKLKPDLYEPLYARIIFSSTIRIKDKEKIVFAENKEIISEACDLPLKLKDEDVLVDEEIFHKMPILRPEEQHSLLIALKNSDLKTTKTYKPIALVSDSEYALEIYAKTISKLFEGSHLERIDGNDLKMTDFEPTKNNVFIRLAEEGKNNIYLLSFRGEIEDTVLENMISFLKTEGRSKFYLNHPAVNLDLSRILPICICDKENGKKLKNYVEAIPISSIKSSEITSVVKDMLEEKSRLYRITSTTIEDMALTKLSSLSIEAIDKILDKALKEFRIKNEGIHLTMGMLHPYLDEKNQASTKRTYGFGGIIYENN